MVPIVIAGGNELGLVVEWYGVLIEEADDKEVAG
jgi:hypothetical protein